MLALGVLQPKVSLCLVSLLCRLLCVRLWRLASLLSSLFTLNAVVSAGLEELLVLQVPRASSRMIVSIQPPGTGLNSAPFL